MNKSDNLIRIGVFYDGSYFYKVSTFYKRYHERRSRISVSGLQELIQHEVARVTNNDVRMCRIVDTHYFGGRQLAVKTTKEQLQGERKFDEVLMGENVTTHYVPLQYDDRTGRVFEKRVDVWLALEAFEMAMYRKYNMLVLIAGDSDFIPLVRKLNALGTQVMLVGWNVEYIDENGYEHRTMMSGKLLKEVNYPVSVHELVDSRVEYLENGFNLDSLFVPSYYSENRTGAITDGVHGFDNEYADDYEDIAYYSEEDIKASTVSHFGFSDLTGRFYGFLKGESYGNDIYFEQEALANIGLAELRKGMEVKYIAEIGFKGTPVASTIWKADTATAEGNTEEKNTPEEKPPEQGNNQEK